MNKEEEALEREYPGTDHARKIRVDKILSLEDYFKEGLMENKDYPTRFDIRVLKALQLIRAELVI